MAERLFFSVARDIAKSIITQWYIRLCVIIAHCVIIVWAFRAPKPSAIIVKIILTRWPGLGRLILEELTAAERPDMIFRWEKDGQHNYTLGF